MYLSVFPNWLAMRVYTYLPSQSERESSWSLIDVLLQHLAAVREAYKHDG